MKASALVLLFVSVVFAVDTSHVVYVTQSYNGDIYGYYPSNSENISLISNQKGGLSVISNNDDSIYYALGKSIMQAEKGVWTPSIFAKTNSNIHNPLTAIAASDDVIYWSIGNQIYSQDVGTTTSSVLITSEGASITSIAVDEALGVLLFANGSSNAIFSVDLSSDEVGIIYYNPSSTPFQNCASSSTQTVNMVAISPTDCFAIQSYSQSYGCLLDGCLQDISILEYVTSVYNSNPVALSLNGHTLYYVNPNNKCIYASGTSGSYYCAPSVIGGISFDVNF
jgi:hypothetical protein